MKNVRYLSAFALFSIFLIAGAIHTAPFSAQVIAQSRVSAPKVLLSGKFVTVDQGHPTTGTARIISEGGKRFLELDSQFTTATGPAVEVLLYRNPTVPPSLSQKDYQTIARLKSFQGAQRYELPKALELKDFQSVAIWCRQFNVTFGYAAF